MLHNSYVEHKGSTRIKLKEVHQLPQFHFEMLNRDSLRLVVYSSTAAGWGRGGEGGGVACEYSAASLPSVSTSNKSRSDRVVPHQRFERGHTA